MTEDLKKQQDEQLQEEQLNEVNGGIQKKPKIDSWASNQTSNF